MFYALLLSTCYYCPQAITVHTLLLSTRHYCPHAITVHTLLLSTSYYCPHGIIVHKLLLSTRSYCPHARIVHTLLLSTRYYCPHAPYSSNPSAPVPLSTTSLSVSDPSGGINCHCPLLAAAGYSWCGVSVRVLLVWCECTCVAGVV